MKDERLKRIIEELEAIETVNTFEKANQLISCMAELKSNYPKYAEEVDQMLDIIQKSCNGTGSAFEVNRSKKLFTEVLKEDYEKDSVLDAFKETCADVKDVISEEVAPRCKKVATTATNIGKGFAATICKEIPQIPEGIGKVKAVTDTAKRDLKAKIREWASDDEE